LNIPSVLTSLRRCRLEVENLDSLVMIYKNYTRVGCNLANEDVTKSVTTEVDLLESHEVVMFEEE